MKTIIAILLLLIFSSCSDNETNFTNIHHQGADCLSCHNSDLKESSNLTLGGSVMLKGALINDYATYCEKPMFLQFVDEATANVMFDTRDKISEAGSLGGGNIYNLKSMPLNVASGSYIMKIIDKNANIIANSSTLHDFNGDFSDANIFANRYSCNACHNKTTSNPSGIQETIYVQQDTSLCRDNYEEGDEAKLFDIDTFYILQRRCASCHNDDTYSGGNFVVYLGDPSTTRDSLISSIFLNKSNPEDSMLLEYPTNSWHGKGQTGGVQWNSSENDYTQVLKWIQKQ